MFFFNQDSCAAVTTSVKTIIFFPLTLLQTHEKTPQSRHVKQMTQPRGSSTAFVYSKSWKMTSHSEPKAKAQSHTSKHRKKTKKTCEQIGKETPTIWGDYPNPHQTGQTSYSTQIHVLLHNPVCVCGQTGGNSCARFKAFDFLIRIITSILNDAALTLQHPSYSDFPFLHKCGMENPKRKNGLNGTRVSLLHHLR